MKVFSGECSNARNAAAPDGAPPRRIGEEKAALAPPCPERGPEAGGHRNLFTVWKFHGAFRDLCKVMAYQKEPDEKEVKWYVSEIMSPNREIYTIWLLQGPTGWKNNT